METKTKDNIKHIILDNIIVKVASIGVVISILLGNWKIAVGIVFLLGMVGFFLTIIALMGIASSDTKEEKKQ